VIVDQKTLRISEIVDLNAIDNEGSALLGWCRGLFVVDERKVWVGFTRVRQTKFQENINWVKDVLDETKKPARIALYDFSTKKCLKEIDLEAHGMNVVFSIFPDQKFARQSSCIASPEEVIT